MLTTSKYQTIDFDKLVGTKATLYKRNEVHCFQLGNVLFEVLEDSSDGYRSHMNEVRIISTDEDRRELVGEVIIKACDLSDLKGFELIDTNNGHKWLMFGTNYSDSYYPCFFFR